MEFNYESVMAIAQRLEEVGVPKEIVIDIRTWASSKQFEISGEVNHGPAHNIVPGAREV